MIKPTLCNIWNLFVWYFCLYNLGYFVVYVFTRTSQKDKKTKEESSTEIKASEKKPPEIAPAPAPLPVKELPPIPPEEQLQLFKWILQEKRKVKTRDPVEKKKIDEEKALLKEIIRSGSLPSLWGQFGKLVILVVIFVLFWFNNLCIDAEYFIQ